MSQEFKALVKLRYLITLHNDLVAAIREILLQIVLYVEALSSVVHGVIA